MQASLLPKFFKVLFVLLAMAAGFTAGGHLAQASGEVEPIIGAGLGAATGYVLGRLFVRFWRALATLVLLVGIGVGVYHLFPQSEKQIGPYVDVTFEIHALETGATYQYGVDYGQGSFGTMSEGVKSERMTVRVGQPVTAKATAETGPNTSGWYAASHQLVCRILVQGDEIYVHGDQGTRNDAAEVICQGPVYIPDGQER
jgi:hypothetical protein